MTPKQVSIFVDDFKPTKWYGAEHAKVFKTAQSAYDYCKKLPHIDTLYLDHDTGEGMTGAHMLEKLVEEDHVEIGRVIIISLNAPAILRIKAFCKYQKIHCFQMFAPEEIIVKGKADEET